MFTQTENHTQINQLIDVKKKKKSSTYQSFSNLPFCDGKV